LGYILTIDDTSGISAGKAASNNIITIINISIIITSDMNNKKSKKTQIHKVIYPWSEGDGERERERR